MQDRQSPALIAYISSMVCLFGIFVSTMLVHYNGEIDWLFLGVGFVQIATISTVPSVVVIFTKISKWYLSVFAGIALGLLVAAAVVKVTTGI